MARFVLVHGAWHGGWCFEQVAGELERRGHAVEAPDLPCDRVGRTVHDYAALIGPRPDAVVIGHSMGGLTIPFVEARMRVYLAALLPLENVYADALLEDFDGFLRDEQGRSYWPDRETAFAKLYPDCAREVSDAAFRRLRPQARIDPVPCPVSAGDVFVVTVRDRAVDPAWQCRAAAEHGLRAFELDAGHSPFLTHAAELAALLDSLA
ncbi:MAG TPA: alpha/beta hydrolase [Gaiellaceae bacterium]|nr:alpha/beta hydrolase [Gaiellaceae bacterium]